MPTILSIPSQTPSPALGTALRELATAALHVVAACRATVFRAAEPAAADAASEARAVREMAVRHQKVDRRFADDLFAAADRHERTHGA